MPSRPPHGLSARQLETLCGAWPGVTGDIKWENHLVFSVGGKMFVMTSVDGAADARISMRAADERFLELTDQPGIVPAPYLARSRWVSIDDPSGFTTAGLEELVLEAYVAVRERLSKKLQGTFGPVPELGAGTR